MKNPFGAGKDSKGEPFEPLEQPEDAETNAAESDDSTINAHLAGTDVSISSPTTESESEQISETSIAEPKEPLVGFRIEAMIQRASRAWTGDVPMVFAFHRTQSDDQDPLYSEAQAEVRITAGRFEVVLGEKIPLPNLPKKVWLSIEFDGQLLDQKLEVMPYRSVIQG